MCVCARLDLALGIGNSNPTCSITRCEMFFKKLIRYLPVKKGKNILLSKKENEKNGLRYGHGLVQEF